MERLGILGGTFNPIHKGHIYLAEEYAARLMLEKILIIPTRTPPHKSVPDLIDAEHRLAMCRLAVRDNPLFEVSDIELHRSKKSYTVDTLRTLHRLYPNTVLYFIMGSDMFVTLEHWKDPQEIFSLAVLCTAGREQDEYQTLLRFSQQLSKKGAVCRVLDIPAMPMSSTEIRTMLAYGQIPQEMLSKKVSDYIREHDLYTK